MTLVEIIPLLIAGEYIRRNEWRHDDRYLFRIVSPIDGAVATVNYSAGNLSVYTISNEDAWADDWEILP